MMMDYINLQEIKNNPIDLISIEKNVTYNGKIEDIYFLKHDIFKNEQKLRNIIILENRDSFNYDKQSMNKFRVEVDKILYNIYKQYIVTYDIQELNYKLRGIVLDNDIGWSLFNKMNTNVYVMTLMFNYIKTYLSLDNITLTKYNTNIDYMIYLVKKYGYTLYTNEVFMTAAFMIIYKTSLVDIYAIEHIKKILKEEGYINIVENKSGNPYDMLLGIDISCSDKLGIKYGIQVKSYKTYNQIGDTIHITSRGGTKIYDPRHVHFMYFYKYYHNNVDNVVKFINDNDVKIEKRYENSSIVTGYIFPKKNKINIF